MFLERLKEDISTFQKAFPFMLAKIHWKWQNSLCVTLIWELSELCAKIAIVFDTFLAAVVYNKVCCAHLDLP